MKGGGPGGGGGSGGGRGGGKKFDCAFVNELTEVFGYKDLSRSTVLGTPESVEMNGQIDWQAQQISHLVCSYAGQRCSEA